MDPLISVILPIYNVEAYLEDCLNSLIQQTYPNIEFILVDDGSPDNCGNICDLYAQKDSRFRVIHKSNGGISDARNAGLEAAAGKYIGFVDPDDWISPDMYSCLMDGILKNDAQVSVCGYTICTENGQKPQATPSQTITSEQALRILFDEKIRQNYAWNKLYDAQLWKDIRFPKGRNYEDLLTIYKIFEKSEKIVFLPDLLYFYRKRQGSITADQSLKIKTQRIQAYCERYRDVSSRYPEMKKLLMWRLSQQESIDLCQTIIHNKKGRRSYWQLLEYLSDFLRETYPEIQTCRDFGRLEKLRLRMLSHCSLTGCRINLAVFSLEKKINRIRRLFEHKTE